MTEQTDYYTKKNIASWDEAAPIHESINSTLSDDVKRKNYNNLNPDFNELVDSYSIENKSVIHVCCNNGIDLISVKNKGAGRGVLGWMPDVNKFLGICSSLLAPGGCLLMEDLHPVLGMYEEGNPSYLDSSYFHSEPYRDANGLDYFTYEKYDGKENFWFHHTLEKILMSAISNDLQLEHIKELKYNIGNFCADLESSDKNPPLGINLAWRKLA